MKLWFQAEAAAKVIRLGRPRNSSREGLPRVGLSSVFTQLRGLMCKISPQITRRCFTDGGHTWMPSFQKVQLSLSDPLRGSYPAQ